MRTSARIFGYSIVALGLAFATSACSRTQDTAAQNLPPDAANGNLAPVDQAQAPAQDQTAARQIPQDQSAPAPANYPTDTQPAPADNVSYNQAPVYATAAPPPLPEYTQSPCPGDNYYWIPGYWDYADAGYYWVPGAWVLSPYIGALWTPPYWAFSDGRYAFNNGYWGDYIGFYGGINYGFGYTGRGYYGGYWNGNNFYYNRSVNNVDASVVHNNIYNRSVTNFTTNRVSFNGGPGGVNVRPIAAETAALRERRSAPVAAQVQHVREAAANREQFASVNHGHPATVAAALPLATEYRAPAARPQPASAQLLRRDARSQPNQRDETSAAPAARPEAAQRPAPEQRAESVARPSPVSRTEPAARSAPAERPEPAARNAPASRPQPVTRPEQAARPEREVRSAPAARPAPAERAARPEPAARSAPASRPQPAARQAARPAPEARSAPAARPAPAPHPEEKDKR